MCVCVCVCYVVRSLEKGDFIENSHVLSCFVQLKNVLFNLLCVLDPLSSTSFEFTREKTKVRRTGVRCRT